MKTTIPLGDNDQTPPLGTLMPEMVEMQALEVMATRLVTAGGGLSRLLRDLRKMPKETRQAKLIELKASLRRDGDFCHAAARGIEDLIR